MEGPWVLCLSLSGSSGEAAALCEQCARVHGQGTGMAGGEGGHRKAVVVLTSGRRGELRDRVERVRRLGRRPWRGAAVVVCAARCAERGEPVRARARAHGPGVLGAAGKAGKMI